MEMIGIKNMILILFSFALISCESMVDYHGTVLNTERQAIENVTIIVEINGKIRENYGMHIPDSIHYLKRDSINTLKGLEVKKYLINDNGQYVRFEPYKTDTTGHFELLLHESSVFGQPSYRLIFRKEGFEDYELIGNWKSDDNLEIIMKKID